LYIGGFHNCYQMIYRLCPFLTVVDPTFLGVRLLTQSIAPTAKEAPVSKAVIGALCVLQADIC
jgi:hypothetical protein